MDLGPSEKSSGRLGSFRRSLASPDCRSVSCFLCSLMRRGGSFRLHSHIRSHSRTGKTAKWPKTAREMDKSQFTGAVRPHPHASTLRRRCVPGTPSAPSRECDRRTARPGPRYVSRRLGRDAAPPIAARRRKVRRVR